MTKNPPIPELLKHFASDQINAHDLTDNLVDLYWFVQIFDAGSFSIAANNHGLSKSNLSRRLSQLESRLGVQLLHRNPRSLSLTSTGIDVYRHALEMVNYAQKATDSVQRALDTPSGKISLVLPAILSSWLMPALLNFQNTHPQIQLSLQTADATQEINTQSTDLALSLFEPPADSNQIVVHPLATLTFVNIASTRFKQSEPLRRIQINDLATTTPDQLTSRLQVTSFLSALEATRAGFGYANLPLFACQTGLSTGELKYYNDKKNSRTLLAFTQPHRNITLASRTLLDYLTLHLAHSRTAGILPITEPNGN